MGNEAEISIKSAKNIVKNFDYKKHKLSLVFWDKGGDFFEVKKIDDINLKSKRKKLEIGDFKKFDVAFPVTHGKYGEDGVLQAIFESQKLAYAGCKVLSSALCMDKGLIKNYLSGFEIPQVDYKVIDINLDSKKEISKVFSDAIKDFGFPLFVKPANSGSSVGISKVTKKSEMTAAIRAASKHDSKIIIERGLKNAREIEIAVLGNSELLISEPGELILTSDFYSFDDKYVIGETQAIIPAKISESETKKIKSLAAKIYRLCDCRGFARVDFFIDHGKIYFNEINTLPGFTDISMYPMLMVNMGLSYKQLINRIIDLAY